MSNGLFAALEAACLHAKAHPHTDPGAHDADAHDEPTSDASAPDTARI